MEAPQSTAETYAGTVTVHAALVVGTVALEMAPVGLAASAEILVAASIPALTVRERPSMEHVRSATAQDCLAETASPIGETPEGAFIQSPGLAETSTCIYSTPSSETVGRKFNGEIPTGRTGDYDLKKIR